MTIRNNTKPNHNRNVNLNPLPLCLLGIPLLAGCNCKDTHVRDNEDKPNVILFLIDDFGYGDISFEGNTRISTPGIDRIAKGGARFTRFYQSAGASAPTRASLLTGRYHLETGVWDVHDGRDFLSRDETTIADALKGYGYKTGAFGKWHSGKTYTYFSWSRGFDTGIHPVLYNYMESRLIFNNRIINTDGPVEDVIGNEVVKFINRNKDNPFFAYIPVQSVHEPFNCPDSLFRKYKSEGHSDHVARLYGMTELLDRNIGRVLDAVEQNGLAERTMILFMSDDGPSPGFDLSYSGRRMNESEQAERSDAWGRKHRGGKASIYEGGQITPFYIMWKNKIPAGSEFSEIAGIIDIYPTILDACGLRVPEGNLPIAGRSMWPLLTGEKIPGWDERFYFDNTNFYLIPRGRINTDHPRVRQMSVHHKNYKLIRFDRFHAGQDTVYCELYDLEKDPMEKHDLSSELPETTEFLRDKTEKWFKDILKGGRAYGQAVFEPGSWEERGTPINLDSYIEYHTPGNDPERTSFSLNGWQKTGSYVSFNLNVTDSGLYQIELGYNTMGKKPQGEFIVYTGHDTAGLSLTGLQSSISETLELPAGRQQLTIKLTRTEKKGSVPERINRLVMHRIPGPEDTDVIRNPRFVLSQNGRKISDFSLNDDVAGFMHQGKKHDTLYTVKSREVISFLPAADNPGEIARLTLFRDFDTLAVLKNHPFSYDLKCSAGEKFTLNAEFISKKGVRNSVRAYLKCE